MEFTIQREQLLKPLQMIVGVAGRNNTLPILANALLTVKQDRLSLVATDIELEIMSNAQVLEITAPGRVTIPARKLYDICRNLDASSIISLSLQQNKVSVRSGVVKFSLAALPAEQFPNTRITEPVHELQLKEQDLFDLIQVTHFSMASQDVRYYLNGMLLRFGSGWVNAIAADGHRLAFSRVAVEKITISHEIIVPRKAITELARLLTKGESLVKVLITDTHMQIMKDSLAFTSKLIDAPSPNYDAVIPHTSKQALVAERVPFKNALTRVAAILANEQNQGVRLQINPNQMRIQATNDVHEQAEETINITYAGEPLSLEFNINYLLDVLNAIVAAKVKLSFSKPNGSLLIQPDNESSDRYVVMPMM